MDRLLSDQVSQLRMDDPAQLQVQRTLFIPPHESELAGLPGSRHELDDVGELEISEGTLERHAAMMITVAGDLLGTG